MGKVADILKEKGNQVHTIENTSTVYEAVMEMVNKNVGCLVVTDEEKPCGIITERDYLRGIAVKDLSSKDVLIKDIMTGDLICVDPGYTFEECMAVMTEKKCRRLPVMEGSELVGLITAGDLMKQVSNKQEAHIKHLSDYITGKYPG